MQRLLSMSGLAGLPATFTTGEAVAHGVHPRDLYAARDSGVIIELSRGVFRHAEASLATYPDFLAVAHRAPRAIVCLVSAAAVHDLTDEIPAAGRSCRSAPVPKAPRRTARSAAQDRGCARCVWPSQARSGHSEGRMKRPTRATSAGQAYLDLQNRARAEGRPTQELLTLHVVERWLARLSMSPYADQFIIRGGMLLAAYDARRPTAGSRRTRPRREQ